MIRFSMGYMKNTGLHGSGKRVRINQNLISIIRIDTKWFVIAGSIRIACYYSVIRDDNNLITLENTTGAFSWLQSWVSRFLFPHIRECSNCRNRLSFFPGRIRNGKAVPLPSKILQSRWSLTGADTISATSVNIRKIRPAIYHHKSNKYSIYLVA